MNDHDQEAPSTTSWPSLEYDDWKETIATMHMWSQIVGKIRLKTMPWTNHSWHSTLYVTPTGLTTSTLNHRGQQFDIEFDFFRHELVIRTGTGETRTVELRPRTVASFYGDVMTQLDGLGLRVSIHQSPNEVPDPIPFAEDTVHASYDGDAAKRFCRVLNKTANVFANFRARFLGKCSPVHFFWGSFDLAVTRFSGRTAPSHPGGIPGLPDWITREAYSHEVYSCGFWPGGEASPSPAFYAYAYPVPTGLGEAVIQPDSAFWSKEMGEFFLPYEAVRTSDSPDDMLMTFLEDTYRASAELASWNRADLECSDGFPFNS